MGFRPEAPSGHYQRHIDAELGFDSHDPSRYPIPMPYYDKHDLERKVRPTRVQLAHEEVNRDLTSKRYTGALLRDLIREQYWAYDYWRHEVVSNSDDPVIPLGLYIDGLAYQKKTLFDRILDSQSTYWL